MPGHRGDSDWKIGQGGLWGCRATSHRAAMSAGMIDDVIGMHTWVRQPLLYKIVRQAVRESLGVSA